MQRALNSQDEIDEMGMVGSRLPQQRPPNLKTGSINLDEERALAYLALQEYDGVYMGGDFTDHIHPEFMVPPTLDSDAATHDKESPSHKLNLNGRTAQRIIGQHNLRKLFKGQNTNEDLSRVDIYHHQADSSDHVNQIVLLRLSLWQYCPAYYEHQMSGGNENVTDLLYHRYMMQGF